MIWKPDWTRRGKTHVYVVPRQRYGEQELLACALAPSAVVIDWRKDFLDTMRDGQKRLNLTIASETARLRRIGNSHDKRILTVINTEYMLARFDEDERRRLWLSLRSDFPHLNGILLFTVLDAPQFLPDKATLNDWQADGRLFYAEKL